MSLLDEFYASRDEDKRLLSQHGQVEYNHCFKRRKGPSYKAVLENDPVIGI